MMTVALSRNVGKSFSKLKLVLFIYAEANWEATESSTHLSHTLTYTITKNLCCHNMHFLYRQHLCSAWFLAYFWGLHRNIIWHLFRHNLPWLTRTCQATVEAWRVEVLTELMSCSLIEPWGCIQWSQVKPSACKLYHCGATLWVVVTTDDQFLTRLCITGTQCGPNLQSSNLAVLSRLPKLDHCKLQVLSFDWLVCSYWYFRELHIYTCTYTPAG